MKKKCCFQSSDNKYFECGDPVQICTGFFQGFGGGEASAETLKKSEIISQIENTLKADASYLS